ncbi:Phycobilisome protein [Leptolyngbya sp. PCC 7375]|nr:Phycobilisome protein [Leptolyngbya sp. PCC 7375]
MYEFKRFKAAGADINNELLKIWIARYLPEFDKISHHVRYHVEQRLRSSITDDARQATSFNINHHLESDCALAAVDTQQLLSKKLSPFPDIWELQELSIKIKQIYAVLIDSYEKSFIFSPIVDYIHVIDSEERRLEAVDLVIPHFVSLMLTVGPLLRELKAVYFSSVNHHLVGFMTTQLHLTRKRILSHLTPYDCTWLVPYLHVLDELMCMPWQRICSIMPSTSNMTQSLAVARKMMPQVSSISAYTYQQALQTFPKHISSQGRIQSAAVQASSLRDLNMFQAYIWLCVLEDSASVIEKQLLPLCLQVFSLTDVQWELVNFGVQTIIKTILEQLLPHEQAIFKKQADIIESLFLNAQPQEEQVALLKKQLQTSDAVDAANLTGTSN